MPKKPHKYCREPQCNELTQNENGYCDDHLAEAERRRQKFDKRKSASARGYTWTWHKFRKAYIRFNPVCSVCTKKQTYVAHHILPVEDRPDLIFEPSNIQPMCFICHEVHHGRKKL